MKRLIVLLLLAVLFAPPLGASAAQKKEVAGVSTSALTSATVNVYCTYRSGKRSYSATGSGVFVGSRGVVLTNAHVALPFLLEDTKGEDIANCHIRTGSPAKAAYRASLLYLDPSWIEKNLETIEEGALRGTGEGDFALLYVKDAPAGTVFPGLPVPFVYAPINESDDVILSGYPAENMSFKSTAKRLPYKAARSEIVSLYSFLDPYVDMVTIRGTELSRSGVSGGPVARASGELLGLMTAVENAKKKDDRKLRAITLSYIDRLVTQKTGIPLTLFINGDLNARAQAIEAAIPDELSREVTRAQLRSR